MRTVLQVKNLTKQFGGFTAVDDISFSLKRGEVLGFLGPNGAGKTTTIQMLLGITAKTRTQPSRKHRVLSSSTVVFSPHV